MPQGSRTGRQIHIPPYRLDLDSGLLRAGERTVSLRPKTWAVLCYLAERPGVLVTKGELLDAIWGGIAVSEATLTKSIGEIRDALQDEVRQPRFVETVHRRGFRFVAPIGDVVAPESTVASPAGGAPSHVVGRDAELHRLGELLEAAARGARQIAFVTGEAGIGKTSLVEVFLGRIANRCAAGEVTVAAGRCIRRHSTEEPLMPVLAALGRLAQGPHAGRVVQLLREHAPGWLVQLPWLLDPGELRELRASLSGSSPARMLRVFAEFVEELTRDVTLVLVLEDLHWTDASTVDLVSILAERPERARLLLLGTFRPADVIVRAGPFDTLRRSLRVNRRSVELPLDCLSFSGVEAYLAARFGGHAVPGGLALTLHAHTDGNPLFLVTAVDHLSVRGFLEETARGVTVRGELTTLERHIPGSLQELFETQILDLQPFEISVLEAGAIVGLEFGAQAVAAAIGAEVAQVEDVCEGLVRSQRFLRASGTEAWPDGVVAARYAFAHVLYQRGLADRLPAGRRRLLHQRIGERLEAGFGVRASDIAVELAAHFEQGLEPLRAIAWLASAATSAQKRFAPREAVEFLRHALGLLDAEPEGPERRRYELGLRSALGAAAIAMEGFASEEAWVALTRARELAAEVGDAVGLFQILYMLCTTSQTRADAVHVSLLAPALAEAAGRIDTPEAHLLAAGMAASGALWEGRCADAAPLTTVAAADPDAIASLAPGENFIVWARGFEGWRLWLLGFPDRALRCVRATLAGARARTSRVDLAMVHFLAAQVCVWRGDLEEAALLVEEGRGIAGQHGFGLWHAALGGVACGIQLARDDAAGAVRDLRDALAEFRRLRVAIFVPWLLVGVAEASLQLGELGEGLAAIDEGLELVRTTLARLQTPELWRVRGALLAARGEAADTVKDCFQRALEIARSQGALAFELRAATALARHHAAQGRTADARATLAARYEACTEGPDTTDLRAARALLRELDA
jgi:DNA-binding winged helix-turn-helix (wHTH) protein/tetratricopeptide (TPR) repeat protein